MELWVQLMNRWGKMYGCFCCNGCWNIADDLIDRICIEAQKLKVAPWTDNDSDMGPVISKEHKNKIENYISRYRRERKNY